MTTRNQVFCFKTWKLWRTPPILEFNTLWRNFAFVSCLTISTNECSGFFLFCSGLELLIKMEKTGFYDCAETRSFLTFANNSRSEQNRKIPNSILKTLVSKKRGKVSRKNINLYRSWSSSKFFKNSFSKTLELYLNFCEGFCIT